MAESLIAARAHEEGLAKRPASFAETEALLDAEVEKVRAKLVDAG